MNQGSSSAATHDAPANNHENNENDDGWEVIRDAGCSGSVVMDYREAVNHMSPEELEKFIRSCSRITPTSWIPAEMYADPAHTCNGCAPNGGPSGTGTDSPAAGDSTSDPAALYQQQLNMMQQMHHQSLQHMQHQQLQAAPAGSLPYIRGSYFASVLRATFPVGSLPPMPALTPYPAPAAIPLDPPAALAVGSSNPLAFYCGPEWTRLVQMNAALAGKPLMPQHPLPSYNTLSHSEDQFSRALADNVARFTQMSAGSEQPSDQLINEFMRSLLAQYEENIAQFVDNQSAPSASKPNDPFPRILPESFPGPITGPGGTGAPGPGPGPAAPPAYPPGYPFQTLLPPPLLSYPQVADGSTVPSTTDQGGPGGPEVVPLPPQQQTAQPISTSPSSSYSLLMLYVRKLLQTHEYAMFRQLERKVICAYAEVYMRQLLPLLPTAAAESPSGAFDPTDFGSIAAYVPNGDGDFPHPLFASSTAPVPVPAQNGTAGDDGHGTSPSSSEVTTSSAAPSEASAPSAPLPPTMEARPNFPPFRRFDRFRPSAPTSEQNQAISDVVVYVQARWPPGSDDIDVCRSISTRELPPCVDPVAYSTLMPSFYGRFGEPLASFLAVLTVVTQEEMKKEGLSHTDLMARGARDMKEGPNWQSILIGLMATGPKPAHAPFSVDNDIKVLRVMRDLLLAIGDEEEKRVVWPSWPTREPPIVMDTAGRYYHAVMQEDPTQAVPTVTVQVRETAGGAVTVEDGPDGPVYTVGATDLIPITEEELEAMMAHTTRTAETMPRLEMAPEMGALLMAMQAAGVRPPTYASPVDLVNKLILFQYHYGVAADLPAISSLATINPINGMPMTPDEITRQMLTPPELQQVHPRKDFYHPCNVMFTNTKKPKRIEYLEISSDEEGEDDGYNSFPLSIKKDHVLGFGKFGTVFEGLTVPQDQQDQRIPLDSFETEDKKVAIKVVNRVYGDRYPYLLKQMDYEISTLIQCVNFPAIVQFVGYTENCFNTVSPSPHGFIVMELLGCNLEDYVRKQDPNRLSELHAKVIIRQVQAALNYLHCRGISHCDVKPANILMNDKSRILPHVKLADFGHVRFYGDYVTETEIAAQTAALGCADNRGYRAPEYATAMGYAPELDMYALGAVAYFIMTGFVPGLTAPRANQAYVVQKTLKKGKKTKRVEEIVEIPRHPTPSVAAMAKECVLYSDDERLAPEEQWQDLPEHPALWPYTTRLSYHFCREHMRCDPRSRMTLRASMDHEWLSGFEMYSMLRRLECKMGLHRPSERHLTTVLDDVNYQRGMLYMAANPSAAYSPSGPLSSLATANTPLNSLLSDSGPAATPTLGTNTLLDLYQREGDNAYLYAPVLKACPRPLPLTHPDAPMLAVKGVGRLNGVAAVHCLQPPPAHPKGVTAKIVTKKKSSSAKLTAKKRAK